MRQPRIFRHLRKYFTPDKQLSSPLYARLYLAFHWLIWAPVIIFVKPHLANALAFSGVLLGTIGASVLYRETVLSEEEIAIEAANISKETGQTELQDWIIIAFNALAGSLILLNYLALMVKNSSETQNLKSALGLLSALFISLVPPIITYVIVRVGNARRARRASLFDPTDFTARRKYITHKYRLMGACFIVLGGWAQIPLILASSPAP